MERKTSEGIEVVKVVTPEEAVETGLPPGEYAQVKGEIKLDDYGEMLVTAAVQNHLREDGFWLGKRYVSSQGDFMFLIKRSNTERVDDLGVSSRGLVRRLHEAISGKITSWLM